MSPARSPCPFQVKDVSPLLQREHKHSTRNPANVPGLDAARVRCNHVAQQNMRRGPDKLDLHILHGWQMCICFNKLLPDILVCLWNFTLCRT